MSTARETFGKLLKALDCLLIENFSIQDKTLLEKLLSGLHNADVLLETIPIGTHCKWFSRVLEINEQQTVESKNSSIHLFAFAIKYLAILIKSNNSLFMFIETGILQSMINQIKIASNLEEPSVFNAYMTLLKTLNTHKRGLEYIFQEGLWKTILFTINKLTVPAKYVEIQSSQFIADLMYQLFEYGIQHYNDVILKEIFSYLCSIENLISNKQPVKAFFAYNVYVKTLILLLEKFIGTKYQFDVCLHVINKHSLSDVLVNFQKLLNVAPFLLKNYLTLHLLFDCYTIWPHSDMKCILKSIFSHMNTPKDVKSYKQINNLYILAIKYAKLSNVLLEDNIVFEKELIIGQLIPLKKCTGWLKYSANEKFKFDSSCVVESKYILDNCDVNNSIINEVAISSILNIIDIIHVLKQESLDYLVIFFSTFIDQFLYSDNWIEEHQNCDGMFKKILEVLSYVFICLSKVLEEWKLFNENTIHSSLLVPLLNSRHLFFYKSSHSSIFLQNGLKLISTALNKIIYKNVQHENTMIVFDQFCTMLNDLLLDTRPEIRDSCLQCISYVIVASKYSSGNFFIRLVLKKKLPISVLNTLKYDNDPFVKEKALKCLEQMVSVSDIWETSLRESDLMTHCLNLMQCESEGIIRRQIVNLITALFNYNIISNELFNEICTAMVHISIKDPLWEVKIFTYKFWGYVIQEFIKKSSELNNVESLNVNLSKLSENGCLHVLYVTLKEEYDLVVQKKAICLTKELLDFMKSSKDMVNVKIQPKNEVVNSSDRLNDESVNCSGSEKKKSRKIDSVDRVLNSISTTCDSELLPSLKYDNLNNIYPYEICLNQKTDDYISFNEFLNFTSTYNFNDCDVKKQWVISTRSGLDSMLDDIIDQSQNCFIEGADLIDCH